MSDISVENKRIARNSIFLNIRMVFVMCIMLYTTRAILQVLGVEDYGVYTVVCGFVSLFAFLNTSMSNAIQRFYNFELGKNGIEGANCVYCTSLQIQLMLAIIIIVFTETFGLWYLYNKMVIPENRMVAAEWIFHFSLLNLFFVVIQAPYSAAVMAHERMDFFAIVSVIDVLLKLGIVFLIPLLHGDMLILYGILMAVISFIDFIMYFIYCKGNFEEIRYYKHNDKTLFKSMVGFSGWNLFGTFSTVVREQGVNLILNFFYGPIVNAAQGISSQINGGLQNFVSNISTPVRPQVIQSYAQNDIRRTMSLTFTVSRLSCFFLMVMAIPVSLEIDYILSVWLGDNVPSHTNTFTVIILMTSIISNLNAATSGVVHATGKMKNYQLLSSITGISSLPLAYVLLCFFDLPELAMLSIFISSIIGHTIGLFVVRSLVGMSLFEYISKVVKPIVFVLFFSLIIIVPFHYLMNEGFLRLIAVIVISLVSISLIVYHFTLEQNERELLNQMISSLRRKVGK